MRKNREQSYHALVELHAGFVYRVALRVVGEAGLAEDATQETFIALLRQDVGEIENLRPWLGRVATNAGKKMLRSSRRRKAHEEGAASMRTERTTPSSDGRLEHEELLRHVDELPIELRAPLQLRYFEELPQVEIAEILEVSEPTVTRRLEAARGQLRTALASAGSALSVAALAGNLGAVPSPEASPALVARLHALPSREALPVSAARGTSPLPGKPLLVAATAALGLLVAAASVWLPATRSAAGPEVASVSPTDRSRGSDIADRPSESRPEARSTPPTSRVAAQSDDAAAMVTTATAPPPSFIHGVVLDEHGRPLSGVKVEIGRRGKGPALAHVEDRVVTDVEGRWSFPDIDPTSVWNLRATLAGRLSARFQREPDRTGDLTLVLHATWSADIFVWLPDGNPATGAMRVTRHAGSSSWHHSVEADERGLLRIDGLDPTRCPPGATTFEVDHPRLHPGLISSADMTRLAGGRLEGQLHLRDGGSISGTVRDAHGEPFAGATVKLEAAGSGRLLPGLALRETLSDVEGGYRFAGIAAGRYMITAVASGVVLDERVEIPLADGEARGQDLILGAGRIVRGTVLDPSGKPCPHLYLEITGDGPALFLNSESVRSAETDEAGRFQVTGLPWDRDGFYIGFEDESPTNSPTIQVASVSEREIHLRVVLRVRPPPPADPADADDTPPTDAVAAQPPPQPTVQSMIVSRIQSRVRVSWP